MKPEYLTIALSALAIAGQAVNLLMNWKLKASQLESERRILARVERKYQAREVTEVTVAAIEKRLDRLETQCQRG